jgi:hypothetical protein
MRHKTVEHALLIQQDVVDATTTCIPDFAAHAALPVRVYYYCSSDH